MMRNAHRCAAIFLSLVLWAASPDPARGQTAGIRPPTATSPPLGVPSPALASAAVHETTRGVFIDPLVTEHAFVDRKVRLDFGSRLQREDDAGTIYVNEAIFEYAITSYFSLELVQPFLLIDPDALDADFGIGDLNVAGRFQLTRADETGGLIVAAGMEFGLPSGEASVGAGDEYVLAPLAGLDWAIGPGRFKLQSQGELEIAFGREGGDGELEAVEWNTALSYFGSEHVVPLLELNTAFEGLEEDTQSIFALTPGVVVSLRDLAGKSFDVAAGAQIFFGSDREEDLALLLSLRHHWPLEGNVGVQRPAAH